jgi:hypothetical protein
MSEMPMSPENEVTVDSVARFAHEFLPDGVRYILVAWDENDSVKLASNMGDERLIPATLRKAANGAEKCIASKATT